MSNPFGVTEDPLLEQGNFGLMNEYSKFMIGKTSAAFVLHLGLLAEASRTRNINISRHAVADLLDEYADALDELVNENLVYIDQGHETLALVDPARFVVWTEEAGK